MKILLLHFLFFISFVNAQESIPYVKRDLLYKGGFVNFYKEAHQVIIDKKLKPCEKTEGLYHQEFIITKEGEFKKIENHPNVYNANKCASALLDEILPELKNWIPAQKDGEKITAKSLFAFIPNELFDNYKEGYDANKLNAEVDVDAEFPDGGVSSFRDEVAKKVNLNGFKGKGKVTVLIGFVVNAEGSVTDVVVNKSSGLKEFDDRFVEAIKKVNKKWKPAKIGETPVRQRYKLPFTVNFD